MTARDYQNPALVDDAAAFSLHPPRPSNSWGYGFDMLHALRSRPRWESAGGLVVLAVFGAACFLFSGV